MKPALEKRVVALIETLAVLWRKRQWRPKPLLAALFRGRPAVLRNRAASEATARHFALTRDVQVGDAVAYLCFGNWEKTFIDAASSARNCADWELRLLQQAAYDGLVPVWGRTSSRRVYELIAPGFWRENTIDWFGLLNGRGKTEPLNAKDLSQTRHEDTMTSRAAIETWYRGQPEELRRTKATVRKLLTLLDEGGEHRDRLVPEVEDLDHEREAKLTAQWTDRVLTELASVKVSSDTLQRFKKLETFATPWGSPSRSEEQKKLENVWNKSLQILGIMIREIQDAA